MLLFAPIVLVAKLQTDTISAKEFKSDEVIVIDNKFNVLEQNIIQVLNSTDDMLKYNNSIDFITRANFASEAVIRGYSQDRLNVTIDGMRMFSACIDKMDPVTSYIEVENLKSSEVSADKSDMSHGMSVGGSLNFITNKPEHNDQISFVIDNQYSTASEYYNSKSKFKYSTGNFATLASFSIKNAGNYSAGNNTPIGNSGFEKQNFKLNTSYKSGEKTTHSLEYIYDHSADVGYPALIMDTRKTQMNFVSYQFLYSNISDVMMNWETKIYYNNISHLMDDYDRSEEEINNRIIMPGMYMPMDGHTETMGFTTNTKLLFGHDILKLSLDAYKMNAFSDMTMELLETHRKMYLENLGDIGTYSGGLFGGYFTQLDDNIMLKLNGRVDFTTRTVNSEFSRAITESYWGNHFSVNYLQFNTSANIQYDFNKNSEMQFTVSRVERAPTHLESFGFYIYNIADNSIYIGNPDLHKEKSYSVNLGYNYKIGVVNVKVNLFNDYIIDYIAGIKDDGINVLPGFAQSFKLFQNIGDANVLGLESSLQVNLSEEFGFLTKVKYQNSQSLKYNESLPFTPPLSGLLNVSYSGEDLVSVVSAEFASAQNNISQHITLEDRTPGYVILNLRNNYKISSIFTARFGIENLFDKYYYTHFSVNNLPNLGRNFYFGLVIGL